jgi:uncharacterized protein (DUF697 family)
MTSSTADTTSANRQEDNLQDNTSIAPLQSASEIIGIASGKASAIAALPIPLVDVVGVVYIQTRMVQDIAEVYSLEINDQQRLLLSNTMTVLLGKTISSLTASFAHQVNLTFIIKESVIKAAMAGFFTKVTGDVYLQHIRSGQSLESLSPSLFMDYVSDQITNTDITASRLAQNSLQALMSKYL